MKLGGEWSYIEAAQENLGVMEQYQLLIMAHGSYQNPQADAKKDVNMIICEFFKNAKQFFCKCNKRVRS